MDCPHCGTCESVMTDVFDDVTSHYCTFCGHDVTQEIEQANGDDAIDYDEEYLEANVPGTEGIEG